MGQQPEVKPLTGSDRDQLLNTNARVALEKLGRKDWADAIEKSAQMTGGKVQPYEIFTTISRESGFNPNARSKTSSATGLGQFVNKTAEGLGIDPTDPQQSIYGIGKYLSAIKQGGISDPAEAQKAYMLGEQGYRNWKNGKPNVAGVKDINGLANKFNNDVGALSEGNYNIGGRPTKSYGGQSSLPATQSMALNNMAAMGKPAASVQPSAQERLDAIIAMQQSVTDDRKRKTNTMADLRKTLGQSELNQSVAGLSGL